MGVTSVGFYPGANCSETGLQRTQPGGGGERAGSYRIQYDEFVITIVMKGSVTSGFSKFSYTARQLVFQTTATQRIIEW